jgi:hypothetical protein
MADDDGQVRKVPSAEIYHIREPQKIPLVMSQDETRRLLAARSRTICHSAPRSPRKQIRPGG